MWEFLRSWWKAAAAWLGGQEPLVLLATLLMAVGAWAFIFLGEEILEGETRAFDVWALKAAHSFGGSEGLITRSRLEQTSRDVTALGGSFWLVFFTLVVAGYLWLDRKWRMGIFVALSTATGFLLSRGLKMIFARPRPEVVPHLMEVSSPSFPSGHALRSAVVYLTLAALLAATLPALRLKIYVLFVALLVTGLVGMSRIFLGVHYPTDVLAGWSAGLVWALLWWLAARWLQRRGQVEPAAGGIVKN